MKNRAERFFTPEERQRIVETVQRVEQRTSGEIVPMLVGAADDYAQAEVVAGGCFALATAALLSWQLWNASLWYFLPAFLLLYLPCRWLLRWLPAVKRSLLSAAEIDATVTNKALAAFVERGLHHTRDATGILILICLFEHRVQVLADRGINAVVPQDTWDEIVTVISDGIHRGQACDALCRAVERCGDLLAESFPPRPDNRDELPNLIVEGRPKSEG